MSQEYTNILIELNKAVKALNFYPRWHPRLVEVLEGLCSVLKESTAKLGEIKWKVDNKGIYDGKTPIGANLQPTVLLARQLFLRKVKAVRFLPSIQPADINAFLEILNIEPRDIFDKGGVEKVLAAKGATGILLNEMSYEELEDLRSELKKEDQRVAAKKMEHTQEAGEMEEGARLKQEQKQKNQPEEKESLLSLLSRVNKETDYLKYNDLTVRIMEETDALIGKRHFDEIVPVLFVFLKHSLPKYAPSEEIRGKAQDCLLHFLITDPLLYLIKRVSGKDEPERAKFQMLLLKANDEVIDLLLDTLIETPQANARRYIFNTLIRIGGKIRPMVVERLADARWYVARQMVTILGELGGEESLEPLEGAYQHTDVRVKKEVLKSLGRIPSTKTSQILLSAIRGGDRSLAGQAIISMGMLKEASAISALGELSLRREAFTDNFQMKKEAIKALGIIGDKRAVPYLTKLLSKKVWFGKDAHEELRTLAVSSLGKIGGREAIKAVEEVYKDSSGTLYNTCKRVLEGSGSEDDAGLDRTDTQNP